LKQKVGIMPSASRVIPTKNFLMAVCIAATVSYLL